MIPTKSPVNNRTRMAFDPIKSPYYKVIQSVLLDDDNDGPGYSIQLHTYSSETGSWSVYGDHFHVTSFKGFKEGVYWNDAIHWLNVDNVFREKTLYFKLDIKNEQPVLTELELPVTIDGKSSKLFESRGCLLLLEWSVKYTVNLDDIMMPLPKAWRIRPCVWSIVLGEREEDSFMIFGCVLFSTEVYESYELTNCVLKSNIRNKNIRWEEGRGRDETGNRRRKFLF
ncbi:hypothetical protein Tco_0332924 [Tanacetum coccineum]